jgi:hypothetical protein
MPHIHRPLNSVQLVVSQVTNRTLVFQESLSQSRDGSGRPGVAAVRIAAIIILGFIGLIVTDGVIRTSRAIRAIVTVVTIGTPL